MFRLDRRSPVLTITLLASLLAVTSHASADQVELKVGVANPTMLAGDNEINYVRIALSGFDIPNAKERPPVNVAIVIDNSGSMTGSKLAQAQQAAIAAIDRLSDDDIISVVLYNSSVQVLVPATKATDRDRIIKRIHSIGANGGTALFAGVSKGAAEVRKFLDEGSVNRVVLLSDGRANVGPRSPRDLERLGESLLKEGVSVSTLGLGLGYNEDLMSGLASAASGNHMFVEEEDDLVAVFNTEFNDLMSVVASDFEIHARVGKGVRPVRVLGTKAEIMGRDIHIPLAQLYAKQQRYFVLEVEVDSSEPDTSQQLVSVNVEYQNMFSESWDKLSQSVGVKFSDSVAVVNGNRDDRTYAHCAVQLANERNMRATELRDQGKVEEAKSLLSKNVKDLERFAASCREKGVTDVLPDLEVNIEINKSQVKMVEGSDWNRSRKTMRAAQSGVKSQQSRSKLSALFEVFGSGSSKAAGRSK
ncbi:MAG: VWA domain-containing protein [Rubripirellula sp.]